MRLSAKDLRTIQRALNYAMQDRDSFADANHREGPVAERASKDVRDFEALHAKLFGCPSARAQDAASMAAAPLISIYDLGKRP